MATGLESADHWLGRNGQSGIQAGQPLVLAQENGGQQLSQSNAVPPAWVLGRAASGAAPVTSGGCQAATDCQECSPSQFELTAAAGCDGDFSDLNLVESVTGLQGLKSALASNFVTEDVSRLSSFRRGYIVDLDRHWVAVHAAFRKGQPRSLLSLVVFDTLEVNYQHYHRVGLLRSTEHFVSSGAEADGIHVAHICQMLGIEYEISFLAPICDMRRLTLEEEEDIRAEKRCSGRATTVYYDRLGNPFRKIIVQPVLQAERDGTCKSRALAALGWLLRLDEQALDCYVTSTREPFFVELRRVRGGASSSSTRKKHRRIDDVGEETHMEEVTSDSETDLIDDDGNELFGTLMSTGRRDKFGRDIHLKVCHVDTMRYNQRLEAGCKATTQRRCLPDCDGDDSSATECSEGKTLPDSPAMVLLPGDSREASLHDRRKAELGRIREVLLQKQLEEPSQSRRADALVPPTVLDNTTSTAEESGGSMKRWRTMEDHEARWHFLEETCFFGHNLGFKKIKKLYPAEELAPRNCTSGHFCATKYVRKYMVSSNSTNYITHEADPMFHEPLENFLEFLCGEQVETQYVPFYVLPFPNVFMALSLQDYVKDDTHFVIQLEGDPAVHRRQRVSDYSIPNGNAFLNNPISYNKARSHVSLPVKL
mmetsp:Transcript_124687/g.248919  ORF Transcript_124687/g.248919 Transcript_124687/m.248919 type:complete len:651 (-) Transcript_124687:30-1982(-)